MFKTLSLLVATALAQRKTSDDCNGTLNDAGITKVSAQITTCKGGCLWTPEMVHVRKWVEFNRPLWENVDLKYDNNQEKPVMTLINHYKLQCIND